MKRPIQTSSGGIGLNLILLALRLAVGVTYAVYGAQKLFGAFGGPGFDAFVQRIFTNGPLPPTVIGALIAGGEFLGGLMLLFGFATEIGALALIVIISRNLWTAFQQNGIPIFGAESGTSLLILAACVILLIAGPGRWSVWRLRKTKKA